MAMPKKLHFIAMWSPVDLLESKFVQIACATVVGFLLSCLVQSEHMSSVQSWSESLSTSGAISPESGVLTQYRDQRLGFDSPEAAFKSFQEAVAADDLSAVVQALSPESRDTMTRIISLRLMVIAASDPNSKKEINKLLIQHGIVVSRDIAYFEIKTVAKQIAYISDVLKRSKPSGNDTEILSIPYTSLAAGLLSDITINDDSAHAALAASPGESQSAELVRIDGRWHVHLHAALTS